MFESNRSWIIESVSIAAVASSSISSFTRARARHTSCLWPTLKSHLKATNQSNGLLRITKTGSCGIIVRRDLRLCSPHEVPTPMLVFCGSPPFRPNPLGTYLVYPTTIGLQSRPSYYPDFSSWLNSKGYVFLSTPIVPGRYLYYNFERDTFTYFWPVQASVTSDSMTSSLFNLYILEFVSTAIIWLSLQLLLPPTRAWLSIEI
jgi:hypothetical protein